MPARARSRRAALERGFTLTELMIVIVLISILAALAYPSLRKRLEEAHGREGVIQMRAIAAAQERFRSENLTYLDVSVGGELYPNSTPSDARYNFRNPSGANYAGWEVLAPDIKVPTPYSFLTRAGLSGAAIQPDPHPMGLAWPAPPPAGPWYTIYGVGDIDADGVQQRMLLASFQQEVIVSDPGE